ncbi:Hypothetical predicted protein [Pelobates cultripes]|uniref:Uncharacterized protein n=1 Tax=Pelobates cultripes TaxID=61616 RepID=A0AAD1S1N7_PELCU|nr:Hypothetical predicted protein [Pelobates cultripes]
MEGWNKLLDGFSFSLMGYIVARREENLIKLDEEIKNSKKGLSDTTSPETFNETIVEIKRKIDKTEREVIDTKRCKYLRDLEDYRTGNIRSKKESLNKQYRGRMQSHQRQNRRKRSPSKERYHQQNYHSQRNRSQRYPQFQRNDRYHANYKRVEGRSERIVNPEFKRQGERYGIHSSHNGNTIRQDPRKSDYVRSYSEVVTSVPENRHNPIRNTQKSPRRQQNTLEGRRPTTYNRFQILEHNTSPRTSPFHGSTIQPRFKQTQEPREWDSPGKRRRSWEEGEIEDEEERKHNREKRGRM